MTRPNTMHVWSYLGYRLEVMDDGGEGWIGHVRDRGGAVACALRNRVPAGQEPLLAKARQRVDRLYASGETPRSWCGDL